MSFTRCGPGFIGGPEIRNTRLGRNRRLEPITVGRKAVRELRLSRLDPLQPEGWAISQWRFHPVAPPIVLRLRAADMVRPMDWENRLDSAPAPVTLPMRSPTSSSATDVSTRPGNCVTGFIVRLTGSTDGLPLPLQCFPA